MNWTVVLKYLAYSTPTVFERRKEAFDWFKSKEFISLTKPSPETPMEFFYKSIIIEQSNIKNTVFYVNPYKTMSPVRKTFFEGSIGLIFLFDSKTRSDRNFITTFLEEYLENYKVKHFNLLMLDRSSNKSRNNFTSDPKQASTPPEKLRGILDQLLHDHSVKIVYHYNALELDVATIEASFQVLASCHIQAQYDYEKYKALPRYLSLKEFNQQVSFTFNSYQNSLKTIHESLKQLTKVDLQYLNSKEIKKLIKSYAELEETITFLKKKLTESTQEKNSYVTI